MKSRNTMGNIEYTLKNALWGLIAMIWYRNVLFRTLPGESYTQSKMILWGVSIACIILGTSLTRKKRRNYLSVLVNVLTPYELYSIASFKESLVNDYIWIIYVATVLSVLYFDLVIILNIRNNKRVRLTRYIGNGFLGARTIAVCCIALAWIPVMINGFGEKPLSNRILRRTLLPKAR